MIKIVGLGPGNIDALTIGTLNVLKESSNVFFRTEIHPNVKDLKEFGINFCSYDYLYETLDKFDDVYSSMAKDLVEKHKEYKDIVYAVPGHPLVAEKSVALLLELCKIENVAVEILPAVSFIDAIVESLKLDPINGLKIVDSFDLNNQIFDKRVDTIITQVYDKFIASEVKISLSQYYRDDTEIYFVRAAGVKGLESIRMISLYELDRQEDIDYLTSVYIPKNVNSSKDFNDLLNIMGKLRSEDGCPWDIEQTHASLKRCLIEECYEVLEAIDDQDVDGIIEELGDVLLQVVFHSQIGKEDGYFNVNDVIEGICNKLIQRHPHVFNEGHVENSEQVLINWENIKKEEKGFNSYTEELKHVAKNLPSLIRADKIQRKAAKAGFDWDDISFVFDKIIEEFEEVKEVYKSQNKLRIKEEIGDLIFSLVNLSRFLDIDPEFALNYTIDKFISRFEYIEKSTINKGLCLEQMTLKEMDKLWEEAKTNKL
ncbi:nucleoside triphosphate pyrophosphohydrolase [Clostridium grantii]|uniref:Tetrapyrrole methylase family protein / MazG family protein n=1 Tax=Clostridium grantii DSM 8605 TaxID=1121316 RepID=A0A1M5X9X4_9CLOT|nr:nucleoside triphosphate pyrophosphohydrolase [Clostridium grantii]SHH96334.1 tetrapyrrole methylase family protein / MazG family protein [Clostridium grantii DSM 8605]